MKKIICLCLISVAIVGCLVACDFTETLTNVIADNAESTPMVTEMMNALAENRMSDAKALMNPEKTDNSDAAIEQMIEYINGRSVKSLEPQGINVNISTGTSGNIKQEDVYFRVVLSDNSVIYINEVYVSGDNSAGFTSFQVVLGVV